MVELFESKERNVKLIVETSFNSNGSTFSQIMKEAINDLTSNIVTERVKPRLPLVTK